MKKFISVILLVTMIATILPINIFAVENDTPVVEYSANYKDEALSGGFETFSSMGSGKVNTAMEMGKNTADDSKINLKAQSDNVKRYTVLVLDTSGGVDFRGASGSIIYTADTSIAYVRESAKKFVSDLQKANGQNHVALVTYNSIGTLVSDFSTDIDTFSSKINNLMASSKNYTNIAAGLEKANSLLDTINDPNAIKNVVLITTGFTMGGNYNYTGKYDSSTVGSAWHNSSNGVSLYAYANVAYSVAEQIKKKATIYTLGLFNNFDAIPDEGKVALEFFKLTALDLATSADYFYNVKDPNELEFVFGEIAGNITNSKKTGTFMFPSENKETKKDPDKKRDFSATYYYDDNYFTDDAKIYNPSLSTMSLCLALSAYGSNLGGIKDYSDKSRNARQLLTSISFKDIETNDYFKTKPHEDSMGVVVAHKDILDGDTPYTLIALATRGGGYEAEWAGNFTVGSSGNHQGFETAKQEAYRFLQEYINKHKDKFQDNVKLWFAGYSRAGATVNLLAGKLNDDKQIAGVPLKKENIFTYCFEPPMGAPSSNVLPVSNYDNIHNIVNPSDLVPKVAPKAWSFARYGVDEPVIPTRLTSSNSSTYDKMMKKFEALNTDGSNESIVKVNNKNTHIIDTFQAKKIDPNVDINWDLGHFEKRKNIFGFTYYEYVNDTSIDARLISNDSKDMSAFLDDLILSIAVGGISRSYYTKKLQAEARVLIAQFMGGGYESYKWDKVPDIFIDKLNDNILYIAYTYIVDGPSGVENKVLQYLLEAIDDAGIDLLAYVDLPLSLNTALDVLVRTLITSIVVSNGNDLVSLIHNGDKIFFAHYPELCLAWLQMQDKNYTPDGSKLFVIDAYRVVRINCPVDVDVYDESGNIVASIINDVPQDVNSSILSSYTADGEKVIYLPADQDYRVEIRATGDGELNYSVSEFSYDSLNYSRLVNYNNIQITEGDVLNGQLDKFDSDESTDTSNGSSREYTLSNASGQLTPDLDVKGTQAENAVFSLTVENDNIDAGSVVGGGAYTKDSFAQVSAIPFENCEFSGWYNGDELVSTEANYRFAVTSDTTLTAKFSGTRPTPGNGAELLTITAQNGGTITQGADGYYTEDSVVTITATANAGYVFNGWISSNGGTFEDASNAETTFTMPGESTTITAKFRKISSGGGGGAVPTYTVKFNTNGGSDIADKKVSMRSTVAKPSSPVKDGYKFAGWYTDKELTNEYDFDDFVLNSFTLYAKWEGADSQIILKIGEKQATVFGKTVMNDVAPKVVNDRTMLPIRFIAEALGADVAWDGNALKVTITREDTEIIINIGSSKATVNGTTVMLDSPAFVENDRTYLPLRFVSENLGAKVEWEQSTKTVTITK